MDLTDADPGPGAVSAHCFRLAGQLAGGPVRDALLAMGHDAAGRAREAAQLSAFRLAIAQSQPPAPRGSRVLRLLADLLEPLPAPQRRARPPAPATTVKPAAQPAPRLAAPGTPARGSRLYRTHSVGAILDR